MKKGVTLDDLEKVNPHLSVVIKKEFLPIMQQRLSERFHTFEAFSAELGISRRFVANIVKGKQQPSLSLARSICEKLELESENCISKIILRGRADGSFILLEDFPILATAEIASLVGHSFGDGHIGSTFNYTNTSTELVVEVQKNVAATPVQKMTSNEYFHHGTTVRFSKLVGDLLVAFGAPRGNKVNQPLEVPSWIKSGGNEIKKGFLRALFDDEGSVVVKKHEILFGLAKRAELADNLQDFLETLKDMLSDVGVEGVTITHGGNFESKNEKMIFKHLRICSKESFINFKQRVGFNHPRKSECLDRMIKSIKVNKRRTGQTKNMITGTLSGERLTSKELSSRIRISHKGTLQFLSQLEKEGIVKRQRVNGGRRFRYIFSLA